MPRRFVWLVGSEPPWERAQTGEDRARAFRLYCWSEVERRLYGALAGPQGRPADEERQIEEVVGQLEASADPPAAFRQWVTTFGG